MLEIKNTVTGTKNAIDGPVRRLDMTDKRITEYEDMSIETSKTKIKRGKKSKKK